MQSVKLVTRRIGISNKALDVYSVDEVSDYLASEYGSKGYELQNTHYLGEIKDGQGATQGYSVMFVLVKNEEAKAAKAK